MKCSDIKTLSLYADKELAGSLMGQVQRHLQDCPACRKNLFVLTRYKKALSSAEQITESEHFDFEFRQRLDEAIAARKNTPSFERMITRSIAEIREALTPRIPVMVRAAAAFLVIISITSYFYYLQPEELAVMPVRGQAYLYSRAQNRWVEIISAANIRKGDILKTQADAMIDIDAKGKYSIRLKELSQLTVQRPGLAHANRDIYYELNNGKVLVDIYKDLKGASFTIKTGNAAAKALGTKFIVDVSDDDKKTWIGVLEGTVQVRNPALPKSYAKNTVAVEAGQKTEVFPGRQPDLPKRLIQNEWTELEELYQIGRRSKIVLLIKNTPDRTKELLVPCPIYIYDEKPRQIPAALEQAVYKIKEAIDKKDTLVHYESISLLEKSVRENPNPGLDVQLLLFIGSYYEYMGDHKKAIDTFRDVLDKYPKSSMSSMAQLAIGIIYEEKLDDKIAAERAYTQVLEKYPNSLEAIWTEGRLKNK